MPPRLAKVPPFPVVATKLLALLADEGCNFSGIAACIATDPALSGQLIKRANAGDLARYCEVRNILQAVGALGMDRTREVSLTLAMTGFAGAALKTETLQSCWHHTLACALIASELARQCGLRPPESYTAALLHDIGRLGLLTAYPAEYEAILAAAEDQTVDLIQVERANFGVDHLEAGAWLAREWKLPGSLVDVIVYHRWPPGSALNDVTIVHVACLLADYLGFSVGTFGPAADLDDIAAPLPAGTRSRLKAHLPALKVAILKEIGLSEGAPTAGPANAVEEVDEAEEADEAEVAPDSVSLLDAPIDPAVSRFPPLFVVGAVTSAAILLLVAAGLYLR